MKYPLFALLYISQLVQGTSINTTSSSCPPPDGTTRSLWGILGSCVTTLLICVWYTIHVDLPGFNKELYKKPAALILLSFFAPEVVVGFACKERLEARQHVIRFRKKGYEWSMTHSFFAEMGGFAYHDNEGHPRTIRSLEFLELCEAQKIVNPVITAKEIKDKSKSDTLGKAILALQLFWFTLQVIARGSSGLAVTLVELDTVCMAVLSLLVLVLWWDKPLRPECPHVLYSHEYLQRHVTLSKAWMSEPSNLPKLMAFSTCTRKTRSLGAGDEEIPLVGSDAKIADRTASAIWSIIGWGVWDISLCATWMILGGLHLIAWNFEFLTEVEKIIWRVASLVLTGSSLAFLLTSPLLIATLAIPSLTTLLSSLLSPGGMIIAYFAAILGVASRVLLVALMLASLRALPCSAYQTVSWTTYIPHL
ncbi:hypothetical protein L210DRAFT_3538972 [Boletus edulis BED1]|uniref:Uncharacterized protein n=1 Tax=Boletus edulis BED1 TaxID=1328754 RepID=A0AAD4GFK9_BOLED|nr:hypothetical protein L210DRAFT_3538972 [Boletus edulis BED1]